ncbi:MAG: hypothetical protein ABR568_24050, partial [Pyrinomonadaceae bacterium]
ARNWFGWTCRSCASKGEGLQRSVKLHSELYGSKTGAQAHDLKHVRGLGKQLGLSVRGKSEYLALFPWT